MEFKEAIKIALQSLWANKMRSVLTLLGVVIGVASVITVVTMVNGANTYVATKVYGYGADVFTVSKMPQVIPTPKTTERFESAKTFASWSLSVRRRPTVDSMHQALARCSPRRPRLCSSHQSVYRRYHRRRLPRHKCSHPKPKYRLRGALYRLRMMQHDFPCRCRRNRYRGPMCLGSGDPIGRKYASMECLTQSLGWWSGKATRWAKVRTIGSGCPLPTYQANLWHCEDKIDNILARPGQRATALDNAADEMRPFWCGPKARRSGSARLV